eukprot:g2104.t1
MEETKTKDVTIDITDPSVVVEFLEAFKKKDARGARKTFDPKSRLNSELNLRTLSQFFGKSQKLVSYTNVPEKEEGSMFNFTFELNFEQGAQGVARFRLKVIGETAKIEHIWMGGSTTSAKVAFEKDTNLTRFFPSDYIAQKGDAKFTLSAYKGPITAMERIISKTKRHEGLFSSEQLLYLGTGKPLPEISQGKLRVLTRRRYNWDSMWTFMFTLFWIIEILVALWAFANGRPQRLFYGYDSLGNTCGSGVVNVAGVDIDYAARPKLWYPDPTKLHAFCVAKCPKANTTLADYTTHVTTGVNASTHSNSSSLLNATVDTVDVSNRCLPAGGGKSASLVYIGVSMLNDIGKGWMSIVFGMLVAAFGGAIWLALVMSAPRTVIRFAQIAAVLGSLLIAAVCFITVAFPSSISPDIRSQISNAGSDTFVTIVGFVAGLLAVLIFFMTSSNIIRVFTETSKVLRQFDSAVIRCWTKQQALEAKTDITNKEVIDEGAGAKPTEDHNAYSEKRNLDTFDGLEANRKDVKTKTLVAQEDEERARAGGCHIRPILMFPIINSCLLMGILIVWSFIFIHLVSLGEIVQRCTCTTSLADCTCRRYFEFDNGARVLALMHFYGLVWALNVIRNVSAFVVSGVISAWFFTKKDIDTMEKDIPADLTYRLYKICFDHHFGSIVFAAFVAPFAFFLRPFAFFFRNLQQKIYSFSSLMGCFRSLLLWIAYYLCCFATVKNLDIDAAIQQMALHGSSFLRGAQRGVELKRRNERRIRGLTRGVNNVALFSKIMLFGIGSFIGVVSYAYSSSESLVHGAPILLMVLGAVAVYVILSIFVDVYSVALNTILMNFIEDCERNIRSNDVYMPKSFRIFIEKYGYYIGGALPADPDEMFNAMFEADKLGVAKVKMKRSVCNGHKVMRSSAPVHPVLRSQYKGRISRVLDEDTGLVLPFYGPEKVHSHWGIMCDVPIKHPSQPKNTQAVLWHRFGRSFLENVQSVMNMPYTAWVKGGQMYNSFGLPRMAWNQVHWEHTWRPVKPSGMMQLKPIDDMAKLACLEQKFPDKWPLIKEGLVKIYMIENEKGAHDALTPDQCFDKRLSSIRILNQVSTERYARRLCDADDEQIADFVKDVDTISDAERQTYLDISKNGGDDEFFQQWLKQKGLIMTEKEKKAKHAKIRFARRIFVFMHQHFYLMAKARGVLSITPREVLGKDGMGDTGDTATLNNFYCAILRLNGIPARILTGVDMWDNNGTLTGHGMHKGAVEGEMVGFEFQQRSITEFYVDNVGWIPADATPIRLSAKHDAKTRRARSRLGRHGYDISVTRTAMANFGNESGLLYLCHKGFEFGFPIVFALESEKLDSDSGEYTPKIAFRNFKKNDKDTKVKDNEDVKTSKDQNGSKQATIPSPPSPMKLVLKSLTSSPPRSRKTSEKKGSDNNKEEGDGKFNSFTSSSSPGLCLSLLSISILSKLYLSFKTTRMIGRMGSLLTSYSWSRLMEEQMAYAFWTIPLSLSTASVAFWTSQLGLAIRTSLYKHLIHLYLSGNNLVHLKTGLTGTVPQNRKQKKKISEKRIKDNDESATQLLEEEEEKEATALVAVENTDQRLTSDLKDLSNNLSLAVTNVLTPAVELTARCVALASEMGVTALVSCTLFSVSVWGWASFVLPKTSVLETLILEREGELRSVHGRVLDHAEEVHLINNAKKKNVNKDNTESTSEFERGVSAPVEHSLLTSMYMNLVGLHSKRNRNTFFISFVKTYAQRYIGILAAFSALLPAVYFHHYREEQQKLLLASSSGIGSSGLSSVSEIEDDPAEGVTTYFLTCLHLLIGIFTEIKGLGAAIRTYVPRAKALSKRVMEIQSSTRDYNTLKIEKELTLYLTGQEKAKNEKKNSKATTGKPRNNNASQEEEKEKDSLHSYLRVENLCLAAPVLAVSSTDGEEGLKDSGDKVKRAGGQQWRSVVKNVSFTVDKGCHVLIRGANGTGKSSIIRAIAGIWPHDLHGFEQGKLAESRIRRWLAGTEMQSLRKFVTTNATGISAFHQLIHDNTAVFPEIVEELKGISDGANISLELIWLCNLISEVEALRPRNSDGDTFKAIGHCSDVFGRHDSKQDSEDKANVESSHGRSSSAVVHGHNEDWSEALKPLWYFVQIKSTNLETLTSCSGLSYPGAIAGWAVAWNAKGLFQTQNSLFPRPVDVFRKGQKRQLATAFIQRHALCPSFSTKKTTTIAKNRNVIIKRSDEEKYHHEKIAFSIPSSVTSTLLAAPSSVDEYIRLLNTSDWAIAASVNLIDTNANQAVNIEVLGDLINVYNVGSNYSHFNQFKHLQGPFKDQGDVSTVHRQRRIDSLSLPSSIKDIANILGDRKDHSYPIYRNETLMTSLLDGKLVHLYVGKNPSDETEWQEIVNGKYAC